MNAYVKLFLLAILLCGLLIVPVNANVYSFAHISDTQNLAQYYPTVLNLTYSYLESQKTNLNHIMNNLVGNRLYNITSSKSGYSPVSQPVQVVAVGT